MTKAPLLTAAAVATFVGGLVVSELPRTDATDRGRKSAPVAARSSSRARSPRERAHSDVRRHRGSGPAGRRQHPVDGRRFGGAPEQGPAGAIRSSFSSGPRGRGNRQGQSRRQVAAGSGFVISDTGWVLTNNHVINGASRIQVTLTDREVFTAKVVGADPAIDVALLKIDAREGADVSRARQLRTDARGRSSDGDRQSAPVRRNGHGRRALGERAHGISDNPTSASLQDLLQTDAAINFGNSGGPLINMQGGGDRDEHGDDPAGSKHRFCGRNRQREVDPPQLEKPGKCGAECSASG